MISEIRRTQEANADRHDLFLEQVRILRNIHHLYFAN